MLKTQQEELRWDTEFRGKLFCTARIIYCIYTAVLAKKYQDRVILLISGLMSPNVKFQSFKFHYPKYLPSETITPEYRKVQGGSLLTWIKSKENQVCQTNFGHSSPGLRNGTKSTRISDTHFISALQIAPPCYLILLKLGLKLQFITQKS